MTINTTRREFCVLGAAITAGCNGWGTDGPAGQNQNETNETAETNETNETEPNETTETDTEPSEESEDTDEDAASDDPAASDETDEPEESDDPDPEPEPESEPEPEPEENESAEPEPNETEPTGTATGVIRVRDSTGSPVEGEPVTIVAWDGSATEHETNAHGEVVLELGAGDPDDVAMFRVKVRDQEQRLGIMSDENHGVQEIEFVVGEESAPAGGANETAEPNETVGDNESEHSNMKTALLERLINA